MKNNATNREVLKITSKEILSLDISDDNAVRQTSQKYVEELLDMPMDSKTEKNLKSFNEKMKGNCPADIQFSSRAPANGVDGEIEIDEMENEPQSDDDNSNKNGEDAEENSNDGAKDDGNKSSNPTEKTPGDSEDGQSESNDDSVEQPIQNTKPKDNAKKHPLPSKVAKKGKAATKPIEAQNKNASSPAIEPDYTSNEVCTGCLVFTPRK